MTMTKYEPKTSHSYRNARRLDSLDDARVVICSILADLTHAEACLRERDAEIERLQSESDGLMEAFANYPTQEPDHAN